MKVIDKINTILNYYNINRQVGHTTKMLDGVDSDTIVITHNMHMSNIIKRNKNTKIASINNLDALRGYNLPIVFDNAAIQVLLEEARKEIVRLTNLVNLEYTPKIFNLDKNENEYEEKLKEIIELQSIFINQLIRGRK